MKKIFLFSVLLAVVAASCKKDNGNPSITVTASFPTITLINNSYPYFSIPLGSATPVGSAIATAYDSFYRESCPIVVVDTGVHTSIPGLYQATATATNKYGYVSYLSYYVAVTDSITVSTLDISGVYLVGTNDSLINNVAAYSPYAGYFTMDNYYGINVITTPGANTQALFAVISPTKIAFVSPADSIGTLSLAVGDTAMTVTGKTFIKQ